MYRPAYKGLKGQKLFCEIVLNEEVVVTDKDRVLFNLDAQAEQFVLAVSLLPLPRACRRVLTMIFQALDKDQHRRPTPVELARHALFDSLYVSPTTTVLNGC